MRLNLWIKRTWNGKGKEITWGCSLEFPYWLPYQINDTTKKSWKYPILTVPMKLITTSTVKFMVNQNIKITQSREILSYFPVSMLTPLRNDAVPKLKSYQFYINGTIRAYMNSISFPQTLFSYEKNEECHFPYFSKALSCLV